MVGSKNSEPVSAMLYINSYKVRAIRAQKAVKFTFSVLMFYWFGVPSSQDHLVSDIVPNPQKRKLNPQRQNVNKQAVTASKIYIF